MPKSKTEKPAVKPVLAKEIKLLLNLFKIEGHGTYRILITKNQNEWDLQTHTKGFPKVTERKIFLIDKINGTIEIKK